MNSSTQLSSIKDASKWASMFLDRPISESNISYLLQYGKVKKYSKNNSTLINLEELKKYYDSYHGQREINWKKRFGDDLNWALSFDHLREKDTTKHVHRLHPYKGKFIPQLVEYFLDSHTDEYKKEIFFKEGDIVLDPFAGSGTTLVQANEMGINAIGIDVSQFNCTISEAKLFDYDINGLKIEIAKMIGLISKFEKSRNLEDFESELINALNVFNSKYFPSPSYKYELQKGGLIEKDIAIEKEKEFLKIYNELVNKYDIHLAQDRSSSFIDKWFTKNVREEMDYVFEMIKGVTNPKSKRLLAVILSRTIRSCRATTHSDLATLKEPQLTTYYCYKHKKICKPLFSIRSWFSRYAYDTLNRIQDYQRLKTTSEYLLLTNDSRTVDIESEILKRNKNLYSKYKSNRIKGIFTSPPYVGQIDYHDQHAYAYDLLGFDRKDELEIGPLYKGQGKAARESYVDGISQVLLNCKLFLSTNYDVFLVANDKYNLYPEIASRAGMKIVNRYKRPVLNRTERDKNPYSEIIFHLKGN